MVRARISLEIFDSQDNLIHKEDTGIKVIEPTYESAVTEIYEMNFKYMQAKNSIYIVPPREERE